MSINCTDREALERALRADLKESRYEHSLRVEEMAVRLAGIWDGDKEKASFAGRYHDIAKNYDQERMDACVVRYGLPDELIGNNALAHSKVGAAVLRNEFGVDDEEVLDAVAYHTTARAGMSLLEEIVYVADVVEEGRTYSDLPYYQQLAYEDLDRCCLEILEYTINYLKSKGRAIHRDTLEAYAFVRDRISKSKE